MSLMAEVYVFSARDGMCWLTPVPEGQQSLANELLAAIGKTPKFDYGESAVRGFFRRGDRCYVFRCFLAPEFDVFFRDATYSIILGFELPDVAAMDIDRLFADAVFTIPRQEWASSYVELSDSILRNQAGGLADAWDCLSRRSQLFRLSAIPWLTVSYREREDGSSEELSMAVSEKGFCLQEWGRPITELLRLSCGVAKVAWRRIVAGLRLFLSLLAECTAFAGQRCLATEEIWVIAFAAQAVVRSRNFPDLHSLREDSDSAAQSSRGQWETLARLEPYLRRILAGDGGDPYALAEMCEKVVSERKSVGLLPGALRVAYALPSEGGSEMQEVRSASPAGITVGSCGFRTGDYCGRRSSRWDDESGAGVAGMALADSCHSRDAQHPSVTADSSKGPMLKKLFSAAKKIFEGDRGDGIEADREYRKH